MSLVTDLNYKWRIFKNMEDHCIYLTMQLKELQNEGLKKFLACCTKYIVLVTCQMFKKICLSCKPFLFVNVYKPLEMYFFSILLFVFMISWVGWLVWYSHSLKKILSSFIFEVDYWVGQQRFWVDTNTYAALYPW